MEHRAFYFDPMAYIDMNVSLYERSLAVGRWKVALDQLLQGWAPLRTVPLLVFAPQSLGHGHAHLYTAAPAMAVFLILLGWMVERGPGSFVLAAAAMLFCCAVPGLYDPYLGLGAYWLDPPGGFLMGAAICCLGLSGELKKIPWLVAFGVFGALAVWARMVTGVYLLVTCAPILMAWMIRLSWQSVPRWRAPLRALAAIAIPVLVIAGAFYGTRLEKLYNYYAVASYGYKSTLDSLKFTWKALHEFVTVEYIWVCVLVLLCGLFHNRYALVSGARDRLPEGLWLATSTFLFLGLSRQIGEAAHAVTPGVVVMLAGCFWTWRPVSRDPRLEGSLDRVDRESASRPVLPLALSGVLILSSMGFGAKGLGDGIIAIAKIDDIEIQKKKFFDELADRMKQLPRDYIWGVYFESATQQLRLTNFFRNRFVPQIDRNFEFVDHESYWKANIPGLDANGLAKLGAKEMTARVDVALVFSDPNSAWVAWPSDYGYYLNPYSALVAERLSATAQNPDQWRKLFEIKTPLYGSVSGFLNLSRRPDHPGGRP